MGLMKRLAYAIAGLLVAAVIFQLFLRYQYIAANDGGIARIDRLTGASCYLPCKPTPTPGDPWKGIP